MSIAYVSNIGKFSEQFGKQVVGHCYPLERWCINRKSLFCSSCCIFHNHFRARTPSLKLLTLYHAPGCCPRKMMPLHLGELNYTSRCVPRFDVNLNPDGSGGGNLSITAAGEEEQHIGLEWKYR